VSSSRAGEKVGNRYRLQALLQEEAASDLYSGIDEASRSKVWVRVLRDEYALQPKVVDHFAELPRQLMRQLGAGLPRVLAVGNDSSGVPYTVWEQLEGRDLEQTLADADEAISFDLAMELMAPVLAAVSRLHDLGKAHGDLRPESVLLAETDAGPQPMLLHVGRPRDRNASNPYAAPELVRAEPNAESDVYSLGMMFFRMLGGRTPKRKETTSLREAAPDLPEDVAALVDSCLADDPDARPPNALELLARAEKVQKLLRNGSDTKRSKAKKREGGKPRPAAREDPTPTSAKASGARAKREVAAATPRAEPVVERRREPTAAKPADKAADKAADKPREPISDRSREPVAPRADKPGSQHAARRDAVTDALARAKKDAGKEEARDSGKAGAAAAPAARKPATAEPAERLKKPAAKADPEEAKAALARQAAVQEALDRAKKAAPSAEAKPAGPGDEHNTHLYEHLWKRKEKKKRNPVHTAAEVVAFAIFAWLLMRMAPTWTNPNLEEVEATLGPQFKVFGIAMASASIAVVGRMLVMQAKVFGSLLQPVVITMSGTALCISVVVSAPYAEGWLQPFQALARQGLAWFTGASFAMGGVFLVRWGLAQVASQAAIAAGSFAGAFVFVLSSGGMFMHGLELPKEIIDFSREVDEELAEEEEELEEGEIGPDGAKKVSLKLKGNLKDEANRVAKRKRAPGDPTDEASLQEWEEQQEGSVAIEQRKEIGGGGNDENAAGVEQLQDVRKDNAATMKGVQQAAKAKLSFSE
jgi:hypothetical protein